MKTATLKIPSLTLKEHKLVIRTIEASRASRGVTLDDAIDQWLTWKAKQGQPRTLEVTTTYIRLWARQQGIGSKPIGQIEEQDISAWVNRTGPAKLATRQMNLSFIRGLYKFLSAKGVIDADPSRLVRVQFRELSHQQKEKKVVRPFTGQEFDALIAYLNALVLKAKAKIAGTKLESVRRKRQTDCDRLEFWRIASVISRCSGLRLGDICQLEWSALAEEPFTVWTDKKDKRVQPYIWNETLFRTALDSIRADDAVHCFPEQHKLIQDVRLRATLSTQFSRLCDAAGVPGKSFHCLRHGYATECSKSGIETPHIARSMGHSSTTTTSGYIH